MPLNELYTESNIIACNGALGSPLGQGILSIIDFKILSNLIVTFVPLFLLARSKASLSIS